ncbi:MAG: Com family DNA-binding transcriptional regulator [Sulfuricellaceae bacterium]
MEEIRCGQCGRKLAIADYRRIEIKCARCGTLNSLLRATSPEPDRHRATSPKEKARGNNAR